MSVNRHKPHVLIIPEDRADASIATGFINHHLVNLPAIQLMPVANGWRGVLSTFETEYVSYLQKYSRGHVILLIDFDNQFEARRKRFDDAVPEVLKQRVFVIGVKDNPEVLKRELGKGLEEIGSGLAEDCANGTYTLWEHEHLKDNAAVLARLNETVKPFVFAA